MKHRTIIQSASRWHVGPVLLGLASAATGCGATVSTGGEGGGSTSSTGTAPGCTCSASTPAASTTCDDTACASLLCYYDNGCGQLNEWHCKDGIWQINTGYGCPGCTCPASTPPPPSDTTWSCDDTACASLLCYYDNGCGQLNEWHCKDGIWQINTFHACP